jgi:serine/threonine protein phosphatase PrpC
MRIEYASKTHQGRRANNEDAFVAEPALGLFAVADGMGGYEGGEIASDITVSTLRGEVDRMLHDVDATWPYRAAPGLSVEENVIGVAIRAAHHQIRASAVGSGSTVACVFLAGERAIVAHVGDSRVYRLRDGRLAQLTRDHSLYEELRATMGGELPPKREFAMANVITRALGMGEDVVPEVASDAAREGDVFLICSDGLVEAVTDEQIEQVLGAASPGAVASFLVDEAYRRGGRDNITVLVLRIVGH